MEATRRKDPIQASRQSDRTLGSTRQVDGAQPKITLGPTKITMKKPMTLAERSRAAERSRRFAEEKAKRLAEKAKQMAEAGDPRAAKVAALAEKATANVQLAQAKVDKVNKAVESKAKRLGADLAQNALQVSTLKNLIKNYREGDPKNPLSKEEYQKLLGGAEADMKKAIGKAGQFEAKFPSMPPGKVAEFAEGYSAEIVKRAQEAKKNDPEAEPPPSLEEMNVAMGQPPGGMKELNEINERSLTAGKGAPSGNEGGALAATKQAPKAPEEMTAMQRPQGAGPELPAPKAAPTQSKSNLGGQMAMKTPQLKQGDQGGWYYETKGGAKVYVQK